MADLTETLTNIHALGSPFLVRKRRESDRLGEAAVPVWFDAASLGDPESGEMRRMIELHARSRGMPVARHAASLAFQRYCHRVCAVSAAGWLLHGAHLNLLASNTAVRFQAGTPDLIALTNIEALDSAEPTAIVETVVDRHLLPVAAALSAQTGPGLGNLWGNIAAGFAGAFRNLSRHHELHDVRQKAEDFLSTRPQLQRGGDFRVLDGPIGPRLQYDRKSCCHWYAAPDGKYCSWCSRLSRNERTQRFQENMAAE